MKRLIIALLLLILFTSCTATRAQAPDVPARAQLPIRGAAVDYGHQIVRVQFVYGEDGYVEAVDIWHGDATYRHLSLLAAPSPSATPPATSTPAPTATITPIPTNTPRPTATSTPEATPTVENTAQPTPAATPFPKGVCYAGVVSPGLNVRSNPSTSGVKYGVLAQADRIPVVMIHVVKGEGDPAREEWGMITYLDKTAWIALWYNGAELARLDDNADCWEIPIEREAAMAPMCLGWHSVPTNVDKNDMQASFVEWREAGQCVAAKGVEEIHAPSLALAFGGNGAVRFARGPTQNGDCADTNLPPNNAALDMGRRILPVALVQAPPDKGYWLEVDNECEGIYFADLRWLDAYLSAEIRAFSAYYPRRVIFGTMLAGAWTQERVNALRSTWDTALELGACLGIHAGSPLAGYGGVDGLTIPWLWKYSFQHRDIRRWLVELDPRYVAIPFCVTEWYSRGAWSPYQPADYRDWARETANDGVLFAAVFTAGNWNAPENGTNGKMAITARLW